MPALGVPGVVEGRASPLECVGIVPIPPVNFCRFCEAADAPWEASRCCRLRRSAAADGVVGVEAEVLVASCSPWVCATGRCGLEGN